MDYDVAAASLASPPASAPVTSYRPAVAVANLGIHTATVSGTLRIYDRDTGLLLRTMNVAAADIAPGTTKNALADQLWEPTPAEIGKAFLFIATIVYTEDQYLPNNNLAPVTITVTAAPPPPPPPVTAHASQHENGGADPIDVEGLHGKLAENQEPTEHASNHESGGDDEMSVTGLLGELADPQTAKLHATSHTQGMPDPLVGYEETAHKGAASGYAPLDADARLPVANLTPSAPRLHYALPNPVGPVSVPGATITDVLTTTPTAPADGDMLLMLADVIVFWPPGNTDNLDASARISVTDGAGVHNGPSQEIRLAGAGLVLNEPWVSLSPMLVHQLTGSITNIIIQVQNNTLTDLTATVRSYILLNTQKP